MELRAYWAIVQRRAWIIAPIIIVIALYGAYQYYHLYKTPGALKAYQSTITMRIGLQAAPRNTDQNYADYLSVSETLADVIVTAPIINSQTFSTEVSHRIQSDMDSINKRYGPDPALGNWQDPAAIAASVSTTRVHNLVTVTVNWSTPEGAWAIAHAIGEVSTNHIGTYLDYEVRSASPASTTTTHPIVTSQLLSDASDAVTVAGPASNRPVLLLVLFLVGCIIAMSLAFLVEYLDESIRSKDEVEQLLQLTCIGEVPPAPAPDKNASHTLSA